MAYHEAGHAVLGAALNDAPRLISIIPIGASDGRCLSSWESRPSFMAQVHLGGFAAEALLTGSRPRGMTPEAFLLPMMALLLDWGTGAGPQGVEGTDQLHVLRQVLATGTARDPDLLRAEVARYFDAAKASLEAVWECVDIVARALLVKKELDRGAFEQLIGPRDIYTPVFEVQRARGIYTFTPRTRCPESLP